MIAIAVCGKSCNHGDGYDVTNLHISCIYTYKYVIMKTMPCTAMALWQLMHLGT